VGAGSPSFYFKSHQSFVIGYINKNLGTAGSDGGTYNKRQSTIFFAYLDHAQSDCRGLFMQKSENRTGAILISADKDDLGKIDVW
jgi:hypothetical protein